MRAKQTKVYKLNGAGLSPQQLKEVAEILAGGGVIVFPTETVYGLGCFYKNQNAKDEIFEIKNRAEHKRLPVMINSLQMLGSFFDCEHSSLIDNIARKFMPGPVTLILNCKSGESIGVRIPDDKFVLNLISACGEPLAATSANISEERPAVTFEEANRIFLNKVDAIIDGGRCRLSAASTIVDFKSADNFEVVREGVYKENLIRTALKNPKNILLVCTGNSCRSILAEAFLKDKLQRRQIGDVKISSAGVAAFEGMPPTGDTLAVLAENKVETKGYYSKHLTRQMIDAADLVLVMEERHAEYVFEQQPRAKDKTFGFLEFAFGLRKDISDPIGKGIEEYRKTATLIKEGSDRIIRKIT